MEFTIIMPNYNNSEWIRKSIKSVLKQHYTNFKLIIVDDCSTDNSVEVIKSFKDARIILYEAKHKVYNGGARNIGISVAKDLGSDYTMFIDSDDWFTDDYCLGKINQVLSVNKPDCLTLSYNCLVGNVNHFQDLTRDNQKDLVNSLYVACWTKCIKTKLLVPFPENTLMEDVVQHIRQCDNLQTFMSYHEPIITWNRNNTNSCSRVENQNLQRGKWQSSMYRYAADLMDLECESECCEEHRKWRLNITLNNIKEGKYIQ